VIDGLVDGIQDRLGIGQQALAGFGQRHATRRAIEKAHGRSSRERTISLMLGREIPSWGRRFPETPLFRDGHESALSSAN
jgi:hypothetical protein